MRRLLGLAGLMALPLSAWASDGLDTGDTAWIMTATALVLFMTLPGLALFYGGLVRTKNVLSVLMQCFVICCLSTMIWVTVGYSLAFSDGNAFIGDLSHAMLAGIGEDTLSGTIPESLFAMFQMTFAVITPALVVGGFAERIKFSAMLWFSALWLLAVYIPITHWVWASEGWLFKMGLLDFAGGLLSTLQLVLDCADTRDWSGIVGDVAKFALGSISIVFDLLFMVQHYVLYPPKRAGTAHAPLLGVQ